MKTTCGSRWAFPMVAFATLGFALGCDSETQNVTDTAVDHSGEPLAGVLVVLPAQSVVAGQALNLEAVGVCAHGLKKMALPAVEWAVSDSRFAEVGDDGSLLALHSGKVTITAKAMGFDATAKLEVLPYAGILGAPGGLLDALDEKAHLEIPAGALGHHEQLTLEQVLAEQLGQAMEPVVGNAYQYGPVNKRFRAKVRITLHYGDMPAPNQMEAPWFRLHRFSNGEWAEVPGSEVDVDDKSVSALVEDLGTFAILPVEPVIESLEIAPATLALNLGDASVLEVTVVDAMGIVRTDRAIEWVVSDPAIASIDEDGTVTALGVGSATVTATVEGVTGAVDVVVGSNVEGIALSETAITLTVGDQVLLTATTLDDSGKDAGRPVKWKSGSMTVARVDQAGLVTALSPGNTKVRAEADGRSASAAVTVVAAPTTPSTFEISPPKITIQVGEHAQLAGQFFDSHGKPMSGGAITWSTLHPDIVSVNAGGVVTGRIEGSGVIQATSGTFVATAEIVVDGNPGGNPGDPGGGHEEGFGNNLSWPVVFAEGVGITGLPVSQDPGIRPTAAEGIVVTALPFFAPTNVSDYLLGSTPYFEQQGVNTWQAEWVDGTTAGLQSAAVKWGDNLTHQTWNTHSIVRIEHVLDALSVGPLQGYNMDYLYGSGPSEMQGTDGTTGAFAPTIYTVTPRLIIERLDDVTRTPVAEVFNGSLAEGLGQDGPGYYSAEVNVAGKIIFGYNFFLRNVTLPAGLLASGWWRITFELDDNVMVGSTGVSRNTALTALLGDTDPELTYIPQLDAAGNRTWLDIYVSANTTGGGGGQHGPPSKVVVNPGNGSVHVGETLDLTASVTDPNGIPLTEPVVWTSSDPSIAAVDQNGTVTGVAEGSATITGTSGGVKGSMAIDVTAKSGGPGGGHDEGFGNNLSWPVVFAEGYGITGLPVATDPGVRPTAAEGVVVTALPFFAPTNISDYLLGSTPYYQQQGENTWRAEWTDGSSAVQSVEVKWGDNLIKHTWNTHSMIRVEHTLNSRTVGALQGYNMAYLFGSGPSEMQGTDGTTGGFVPTVYSVAPRLKIEKLDDATLVPVHTVFNGSIAEGLGNDGPGFYSAEVNVAGKIIFGYNFFIRNVTLPANVHKYGWWRITFALDDQVDLGGVTVPSNLSLDACADVGDPTLIYEPQLDPSGRYSWLDIWVDQAGGGGGGHSGGGGGGQGNCAGGGGTGGGHH